MNLHRQEFSGKSFRFLFRQFQMILRYLRKNQYHFVYSMVIRKVVQVSFDVFSDIITTLLKYIAEKS